MSKEITLLIITYNSEQIIEKCLQPIISDEFEIVVIDNNSSDNTVKKVIDNFPSVKVVKLSRNSGYARSANYGIKFSTTDYVMILNPDLITNVADIKKLLEESKKFKKAVIFAPSLKKENNNNDFSKVQWVCGAAMLINKKLLIENIGFFDENIFLFYEETDLCRRILNAGFEIIKFNNIFMNHIGGSSSTNTYQKRYCKNWHTGWSGLYFHKKHLSDKEFKIHTKNILADYTKLREPSEKDPEMEIRYKAFYEGAIAFLNDIKAFDENGNPTILPE